MTHEKLRAPVVSHKVPNMCASCALLYLQELLRSCITLSSSKLLNTKILPQTCIHIVVMPDDFAYSVKIFSYKIICYVF